MADGEGGMTIADAMVKWYDELLHGESIDPATLSDEELADGLIEAVREARERQYRERTRLLRPRLRRRVRE